MGGFLVIARGVAPGEIFFQAVESSLVPEDKGAAPARSQSARANRGLVPLPYVKTAKTATARASRGLRVLMPPCQNCL